jgi:cell division protein FtsI/penicillin-binding protein 2
MTRRSTYPSSIRLRWVAPIAVASLSVIGIVGCTATKEVPPEQIAAQTFLDSLGSGDSQKAAVQSTDAAAAAAAVKAHLAALGSTSKGVLQVTGLSGRTPDVATAAFSASWSLPGTTAPWTYAGSLPLVKRNGKWLVSWQISDIHPQLAKGQHVLVKRIQPTRAALQDSAGVPLFTATPVVIVGVQQSRVTQLGTLAAQLASILTISATDIIASVKAARPNDFVSVITLRRSAYDRVKSRIHPLPGVVFREETRLLGPSSRFGQPLLGAVGQATKEIIDASSGRVAAGDVVGLSGLQRAFDGQLGGTAGIAIYAQDGDGSLGSKLSTLVPAKPGKAVRLTLNRTAQAGAEAALASVTQAAVVVAVQPSTGAVLAVANGAGTAGNIAFDGQFPAGSTFKIVTYAAALTADPSFTPSTPVQCPATVNVGGRNFENHNKFSQGTIPIRAAFAYSCNTSAIKLATGLPAGALEKTATIFGVGAAWKLPVEAFSGSLPPPASATELAADSIGQGKVLVSPLLMASVAGAAASGTSRSPVLVAGEQAPAGTALNPALTSALNTLMRDVVEKPYGTAHALATLPGQVRGKTGTAEFGTDTPPKSHAWFVGARGDLSFAVFVNGGESSTTTAVPIAKRFLTAVR